MRISICALIVLIATAVITPQGAQASPREVTASTTSISSDNDTDTDSFKRRLALSKRLYTATHVDRLMDSAMKSMIGPMIEQQLKGKPNLTKEDQKIIIEMVSETMEELIPKILERFTTIYAETFTEEELVSVVNFYESPQGQAFLTKLPMVMSRAPDVVKEIMPEMLETMNAKLCKRINCTPKTNKTVS